MDGGGAPGKAIGTVPVITIEDGVTTGGAFRVFTAMYIQGGEDITEVIIGTVARGTTDGFHINNLYVDMGITDVN